MKLVKLLLLVLSVFIAEISQSAAQNQEPLPQIRLAGNAHIDLAYRWRWNETVKRVIPDTFWEVLRMLEQEQGLMGMTVLYNSRDMDPRMDHGQQEVCYAIAAHTGTWRGNRIVQRAMEFNRPLMTMQENKHIATTSGWTTEVALGSEESFYGIDNNDHVIISVIKVLQENWAPEHVVLRIIETEGRDGQVSVRLPSRLLEVVESDHIENPLLKQPELTRTDKGFSFNIGHNQIRTFIVRLI